MCVFRLQPIREAHIQGGRAGSLQDPQRRHGEVCVWGGLHQKPRLPQQGNVYAGIPRTLVVVALRPSTDRHFVTLQPMALQDFRLGVEPDDGENPRRIGRSLSGTVVASRRGRLTATRSFVSWASGALPPPRGRAVKLHLPDVLSLRRFTFCCSLCSSPPLAVRLLPVLLFHPGRVHVSLTLCL